METISEVRQSLESATYTTAQESAKAFRQSAEEAVRRLIADVRSRRGNGEGHVRISAEQVPVIRISEMPESDECPEACKPSVDHSSKFSSAGSTIQTWDQSVPSDIKPEKQGSKLDNYFKKKSMK